MKRASIVCLLVALSGCGYALVGKGMGSVDPDIKRIGVPPFKDATGKPGLDQKVTQKVIEELMKRGHFTVVQDATDVDALVDGQLTGYHVTPVGFSEATAGTAGTQASRYAIVLTARVRYTKTGVKEPIWENDSFVFRDEYDLGDDPGKFVDLEDTALDRLVTSFARSLISSMLEAF